MIDQNLRRLRIGASDLGAIFGVDERRDAFAIWAEKRGGLERAAANPRMRLGKALERGLAEFYAEETGQEVEWWDRTITHESFAFMVLTPDALVKGRKRGVDAKVAHWSRGRDWGPEAGDIPLRIQLQCFWYMAGMDYPEWDVCVLLGGDPRIYRLQRDEEAERVMLARAEEWWRKFLVGNERPPMGHSEETGVWLRQMFPRARADVRPATPEEMAVINEYTAIRICEKELGQKRKSLEHTLKAAIGEREGLTWPEGRFTWKNTKDSTKTEWERLAEALLRNYTAAARQELIAEFSIPKPGYRRIDFRSTLFTEAFES